MSKPVTQRIKLYINGKEIDNTLTSIRKNLIKYRNAANKATEGTEDWKKYNKAVAELETEYDNARNAQKAFRQDTKLTTAGISDGQKELTKFTSSFSTLINGYKTGDLLQVQEGFNGVKTGIKGAVKAAWAFIATPIGAIVAGLVGIGVAAKQWLNYNSAVIKAVEVTTAITGLTDAAANQARIQAESLAETYGGDFEKNLETAKKLVTQFKISYDEAFTVIEEGLSRGQIKNDEYFDSLNEYGTFFDKAGFSATEFKNVISTGFDLGIYKDKLPDAIKEADLAIKEQSKTTKDALVSAFGAAFTDDLLKRVNTGKTTTKQALSEIAKQSDKANLSVQQNAQLTAGLMKGAGEDAGGAVKVFEALNTALNKQQRELTQSEQLLADQASATKRLKDLNSALFLASDKGWGLLVDKAKLFGTKILIKILETGVDVYNWVVDLNNESAVFSAILLGLGKAATGSFKIIGVLLSNVWDGFKSLGDIIEGVFTFNPDKIKEGFTKGFSVVPNLVKDLKNEVVKDANDIYDAFSGKNKMKRLSLTDFTSDNTVSTDTETPTPDTPEGDGEMTAEDKKIIASKQKLKEWLDQWEADKKIQEELESLSEDEAAQLEEELNLEAKYAKLEQDAFHETELLKSLADKKNAELDAIDKKWNDKFLKDNKKYKEKQAADNAKAREKELAGRKKLKNDILNGVISLAGSETKVGQALIAAKGVLAAKEMLIQLGVLKAKSAVAIAEGQANTAKVGFPQNIPLLIGFAAQAIGIISAVKSATSSASKVKSLDKGGYTFGGSYTGGMDGIGGQLAMIHPDEYMIPKPVMQMPETPRIVEYLEAKRTGKPIPSLAEGGATTELPLPEETTTQPTSMFLINVLERLLEEIQSGFVLNYTLDDERKRRALAKKLDDTINASKN